MKSTQVKSHKRKGKVVKSHSRAIKGSMKNTGSGMSAEECKAKYDKMVEKYGEDSPQAKKLAMKMEGMETVDKDARAPRRAKGSEKVKAQKFKKDELPKLVMRPDYSKDPKGKLVGTTKKHSRGSFMRKNVEEELLTKEAKAKIRTAKNSAARGILAKGTQVAGFGIKDYRKALSTAPKKLGSATPKNKKVKLRGDKGKIGYKKGSITDKW